MPDGKPLPAIVFNGNVIPNAAAFQEMFEHQMPPTKYEVQSYDCQVLNPNFVPDGTASSSGADGQNMTILVAVSGFVKVGPIKDSETKGFSESFVLVPNPESHNSRTRRRPAKEWLIQSQNFRFVV